MCGLVGISGKLDQKDKDAFRRLMVVCSLRGEDSAGYINVDYNNNVKTNKAVGSPFELFETRDWDRLNLVGDKCIIGHTRKATVGGISRATAHPFQEEHITGVHNGTLQNWSKLIDADSFKVDSNALFHSIAYEGIEETFAKIKGAWAAVWWNSEENTLNFLRNDQRPLWWATDKEGKKLYWASRYWMLQMLEQEMDIDFHVDEKGFTYHALKVDTLRRFEINPRENKPLNLKADREVKGDLTSFVVPRPFHQGSNYPQSNYKDTRPLEARPWDDPLKAYCSHTRKWAPKHEAKRLDGSLLHPLPLLLTGAEDQPSGVEENTTTKTSTASCASTPSAGTTSSPPSSSLQRPTLSLVQMPKNENSSDSKSSVEAKRLDRIVSRKAGDIKTITGYDGKEMDEYKFHGLTNSECCFCQSNLPDFADLDRDGGKFVSKDMYLCGTCMSDDSSLGDICSTGC